MGAALAALIMACIGGVAVWKWKEAKSQQARAEHAVTAAVWTARALVRDLAFLPTLTVGNREYGRRYAGAVHSRPADFAV
jgi:hypothetical protein